MRRFTASTTLSTLALALALVAGPALPADPADPADGKLVVRGSVSAGLAWRSAARDTDLLPDVNSSLIGWDPLESTCRHASLSIL